MTVEEWIAPGLVCQTLRRITVRKENGAQEVIEAISATSDPPPDELFSLPENPVEKKPSDY